MRKKIDQFVGTLLALLMAAMTLDVSWGVFTRYLIGAQSPWTEELARFLLIWIGLLGAAYVAGQNKHLAIDLLSSRLEGKSKRLLQRAINLIILFFVVTALFIGGLRLVYITYKLGQASAALQLPLSVVYLIIPISGLLVVFYKIADWQNLNKAQK
jgi:TRAP-type C4-dicarboxylate transport system permease small subunit